jgi:hypothetical protein
MVTCQDCGDPVNDHVGQGTPNPDCPCCSWTKNELNSRWITGPLGLPMWEEDQRAR